MNRYPDATLFERYGGPAPRYTSYPTVPHFREGFSTERWRSLLRASNTSAEAPLSLYLHLPFCRHLCFYCGCTKIVTKHRDLADPYLKSLARELDLLLEHIDRRRPLHQLHLGGGTPTFLVPRLQAELLDALAQRFTLVGPDRADYGLEADPRDLPAGTLARYHQFGFRRLSLGVQDLDPAVQHAVHRIQPEGMTRAVVDEARALGYRSINVDLIMGLPRQTPEGFSKTVDRVLVWRPERIAIFHYAHLPELFPAQRAIDPATLPTSRDQYRLMAETIARLTEAGYIHIGLDHFALPTDDLVRAQAQGTLQRNFQGYSTHGGITLLAAGLSAIGDVGKAYAQNTKDLEAWSEGLAAGELPIVRGWELDADDQLRRHVIMTLMCASRIEYARIFIPGGLPFWEYFAEERVQLEPLVADGLLEIRPESLDVSPLGRHFVRHIAHVFDAHDRRARHDRPRYSRVL